MCLFCFSTKPLSQSEMNGKYGQVYGQFSNNNTKFDISLCQAPCREPCCWMGSMVCLCPAQVHMRHKALNHVDPGSGWSNYKVSKDLLAHLVHNSFSSRSKRFFLFSSSAAKDLSGAAAAFSLVKWARKAAQFPACVWKPCFALEWQSVRHRMWLEKPIVSVWMKMMFV